MSNQVHVSALSWEFIRPFAAFCEWALQWNGNGIFRGNFLIWRSHSYDHLIAVIYFNNKENHCENF